MFILLILLYVLPAAWTGHFDGGTIRWAPVNRTATGSPIQIMIIQTYTYTLSLVTCTVGSQLGSTVYGFNFNLWCTLNCGAASAGYVAPPVLGICTGSNSGLNLAFTQRNDIVNVTNNASFSISHAIPNTASQGYYRTLALTSGGTDSSAQWNITTAIDVRPRSDNGWINTPPVANVISPYGIPFNITTQIPIPTMDIDNDDIRCRWSNSSLECGDVCFPRTIPASTTVSKDCILTITGTSTSGWYCASIQVEDFVNTTSLQPMSSVPVQFLIYVYMPKNCPVPTVTSSATCVDVQVGVPYRFNLTAINNCGSSSNISDIAIQGFLGITRGPLTLITPNRTIYTMQITYTPTASQVGLQMLCATALDNTNIPSRQYCITFIVSLIATSSCPTPSTTTTTQTSTTSTTTRTTTSITSTTTQESTTFISTSTTTTTEETTIQKEITTESTALTTEQETTGITSISTTTSTLSISSSSFHTTTTSAPTFINWPLIGSIIGVLSLLALLACCCIPYHYYWSPSARRRRRQNDRHLRDTSRNDLNYQSVNEVRSPKSGRISRPSRPFMIYDVHSDHSPSSPLKSATNVVRPEPVNEFIEESSIRMDAFSASQNLSFDSVSVTRLPTSAPSSRRTNRSNVSVKRVHR